MVASRVSRGRGGAAGGLVLAVLLAAKCEALANPVASSMGMRAEVGLGGPGGFVAARALVPVDRRGIFRLEPGIGYASTGPGVGLLASLRIDATPQDATNRMWDFRLYGGGSVNRQFIDVRDGSTNPPRGTYAWLDAGLTLSFRSAVDEWDLRPNIHAFVGLNVSHLLAGPSREQIGANDDEYQLFGFFTPGYHVQQGTFAGLFAGLAFN